MVTEHAPSYRLATYDNGRGPRAGIIVNETIFDIADALGRPAASSVLALLQNWPQSAAELSSLAANGNPGIALSGCKLLAPILYPGGYLLRRCQLHRPCSGNGEGAEYRAGAGSA